MNSITEIFQNIGLVYENSPISALTILTVIAMVMILSIYEFVVYRFNAVTKNPADYSDQGNFRRLVQVGKNAIAQKNFNQLRDTLWNIWDLSGHEVDDYRAGRRFVFCRTRR